MGHPFPVAFLLFIAAPLWAAEPSAPQENESVGLMQFSPETKPTNEGNNAFETLNPPVGQAEEKKRPPPDASQSGDEPRPAASDDAAAQSGQRLYDGAADKPEAVMKVPEAERAELEAAVVPDDQPADVFVAVDLDLKANPDQYKDAVASLGRVASFRPDPRFAPTAPSPDRISFWGWMPASRVAEALTVTGVTRLHLDHSRPRAAALSVPDPALARFLVSIRVPGQADAAGAADQVVEQLAGLGFQPLRSAGSETTAGGEMVFKVEGLLPVRALSLVLGNAQVLKVVPVKIEQPAPPKDVSPKGFLFYVAERAPFLLILTLLLLLLPRLSGGWDKLCEIFIPYRR